MRSILRFLCLALLVTSASAMELTISDGLVYSQAELRAVLEKDRPFTLSCHVANAAQAAQIARERLLLALRQSGYLDAEVLAIANADGKGISIRVAEGTLWKWVDVTATGALTREQVMRLVAPASSNDDANDDTCKTDIDRAFELGAPVIGDDAALNARRKLWHMSAILLQYEFDAFDVSIKRRAPGEMVLHVTTRRDPPKPIDGLVITIEPRNATVAASVRSWLASRGIAEGLSPHAMVIENIAQELGQSQWFMAWQSSDGIQGGQRIITIKAWPELLSTPFPTPSSGTLAALITRLPAQCAAWDQGRMHMGLELNIPAQQAVARAYCHGSGFTAELQKASTQTPPVHLQCGYDAGKLWVADVLSGRRAAWKSENRFGLTAGITLGTDVTEEGKAISTYSFQFGFKASPGHEFSLRTTPVAVRHLLAREYYQDTRIQTSLSNDSMAFTSQSATTALQFSIGSATSAMWCLQRMPSVPSNINTGPIGSVLDILMQPAWDYMLSQWRLVNPNASATASTVLMTALRTGVIIPLLADSDVPSPSSTRSRLRITDYSRTITNLLPYFVDTIFNRHWPVGSWPDHAVNSVIAHIQGKVPDVLLELRVMSNDESHGPLAWLTMATLASYADKRLSAQLASLGVVKCDAPTFANDVVALLEPLPIFARWLQHTDPRALVAPITDPALRARAEQELRALIAAAPGTARRTALRTCATTLWNLGLGTLIEQRLRALSEATP